MPSEQTSPPWHLDRSDQRALPLDGSYQWMQDGTGVRIYICDVGVRTSHNEFQGRTLPGFSAVDANPDVDSGDHGTQVAACAAGATYGTAKGATVVSVKNRTSVGDPPTISDHLACCDWILANHPAGVPGIVVYAMVQWDLGTSEANQASAKNDEMLAAGLHIVSASGYVGDPLQSPDADPGTIAVGASRLDSYSSPTVDQLWSSTERYEHLAMFAPGHSITTARGTGDTATVSGWAGTSFSSPLVAGTLACLLEAYPTLLPDEAKQALIDLATEGAISGTVAPAPNRLLYTRTDELDLVPDPPSGLTVEEDGDGLRASWVSDESEFVVERERWTAGGDPP